jgi:hypothetical protein
MTREVFTQKIDDLFGNGFQVNRRCTVTEEERFQFVSYLNLRLEEKRAWGTVFQRPNSLTKRHSINLRAKHINDAIRVFSFTGLDSEEANYFAQ